MITRFNAATQRIVHWVLALLFAGLISVVALQVLARNVLRLPMIWTLDVAQLLFVWCIFLGAGVAFRQGAHYIVDLWPASGLFARLPVLVSFAASLAVVYVLAKYGVEMTEIAARRQSQSLGISMAWYFMPIPICGVLVGLAMLEKVETVLTKREPG
ncbi:MAG: TRAP transporter small permease [Granulosicoccus sp.]